MTEPQGMATIVGILDQDAGYYRGACRWLWFWYNRTIRKQTGVDAGAACILWFSLRQSSFGPVYHRMSLEGKQNNPVNQWVLRLTGTENYVIIRKPDAGQTLSRINTKALRYSCDFLCEGYTTHSVLVFAHGTTHSVALGIVCPGISDTTHSAFLHFINDQSVINRLSTAFIALILFYYFNPMEY